MTTTAESTTAQLVPFFVDGRSVVEKLDSERRDWIPSKGDTSSPARIGGLVIEMGEYHGLNERISPTLSLLDADGTVWGVIAFHGFLRQAVERQTPRVGDWVAIAYLGTKPATKQGESDAHVYRLVVERNPNPPATQPEPSPAEPTAATEDDDDIPF